MLPLTTRVSGQFSKAMQGRIQRLEGVTISARIEVPDTLVWWYWQEFGTASSGDAGRASGHSYEIVPKQAKLLVYPYNGQKVISLRVEAHPGIKPRRSVTKALPEIREATQANVRKALVAGGADHPELIRQAILESAQEAKRLIVESIAQNIPGTRDGDSEEHISPGKLGGRTAASVFDEEAQVVDLSS
jgi:hypothetical protein